MPEVELVLSKGLQQNTSASVAWFYGRYIYAFNPTAALLVGSADFIIDIHTVLQD